MFLRGRIPSALSMLVAALVCSCWAAPPAPVSGPAESPTRTQPEVHSSRASHARPSLGADLVGAKPLPYDDWSATYSLEIQDRVRSCLGPMDDGSKVVLLFLPEDDGELLLWEARRGRLGGDHVPDLAACADAQLGELPHYPVSVDPTRSVIMFLFDP
jgi:hypothetical protein